VKSNAVPKHNFHVQYNLSEIQVHIYVDRKRKYKAHFDSNSQEFDKYALGKLVLLRFNEAVCSMSPVAKLLLLLVCNVTSPASPPGVSAYSKQ